jgi:hypothetical protein
MAEGSQGGAGDGPPRRKALRRLRDAVTRDLQLDDDVARRGWGGLTTREVGTIGGRMVRRLVRRGAASLERHPRDP